MFSVLRPTRDPPPDTAARSGSAMRWSRHNTMNARHHQQSKQEKHFVLIQSPVSHIQIASAMSQYAKAIHHPR